MKFLNNKIVSVQDIPFMMRSGGGFYPIESLILREYKKIQMASGLDIYEIAKSVTENSKIKDSKGEQYGFKDAINLILTQDPIVVTHYKEQIKKAFFSSLDIPEKYILVSALMNTRVSQAWHRSNRQKIEEGLAEQPSLTAWNVVFPDFEETFAMSLLNSDGSEPVYNEKEGKLYWTLQQTFRLNESVIDEIYNRVFLDSLEKSSNDDLESEEPDFLSEDSENN